MAVVVEWMLAVFANQLQAAPPAWLGAPIELTLTGPGGGSWHIDRDGVISTATGGRTSAAIVGDVQLFPQWATRRSDWRNDDVRIHGSAETAARFLDAIDIV